MNSICLVVPYFGTLPNYFEVWLNTCKLNNSVNFLLITDDIRNFNYPNNVIVNYMDFSELKSRIQETFEFSISLESHYKLCDFRPAYGHIFEKELVNYDYWGYCDLDLIFGNIRNFITDNVLLNNEKILSRGHFSLFKNCEKMNTLYQKKINGRYRYKEVFANPKNQSFDEWGENDGINEIASSQKITIYDELVFSDVFFGKRGFLPYQKFIKGDFEYSIFAYDDGNLFQVYLKNNVLHQREIMYAHLQKRQLKYTEISNLDKILIVPNKIIELNRNTELSSFIKIKGYNMYNAYYFKYRLKNLKKKVKHYLK